MKKAILILMGALFLLAATSAPLRGQSQMGYEVLYTNGRLVYPAQVTRPAAPFLLVIKNQSRLKNLVFHLKLRGSATEVFQADLDQLNGAYGVVVDVAPGTYDLWETSHPALTCTLNITQ